MARPKSTTTAGSVSAFAAAATTLAPPEHITLTDECLPFWNEIIAARARNTWTSVDLAHAANMARCQADIERLSKEISDEGDIVVNARGTQIVNPKHTLLETLSRRAVSLSRMLHVHAEATVGESREQPPKLKAQKAAAAALANADDDLIPRHANLQ